MKRTIHLDKEGIAGMLYIPENPSSIGIVFGTGILGNRHGLENIAGNMAERMGAYTLTLDPPSHHMNLEKELSFGNYAEDEKTAASYLRGECNARTVIGGGHSGGAIAGLFACAGYTDEVEKLLIYSGFYDPEEQVEKVFDGLIIAGCPADARKVVSPYMFNKYILQAAHKLFHVENRTETDNLTNYTYKKTGAIEWKHLVIEDIREMKRYQNRLFNPPVFAKILEEFGKDVPLKHIPKIVMVGDRDILNFGMSSLFKKASEKDIAEYYGRMKILGLEDKDYHVLPSGHFLNEMNSCELDSLWGLKSGEVQDLTESFIRANF